MASGKSAGILCVAAIVAGLMLFGADPALAHCDGLDGPVVMAARNALQTGNVNLALIWVKPADQAEIVEAFRRTLAVRGLGGEARDLADRYFFETLVRIHRAGEGASFAGLKPAGRDLGPAIPAADAAIESGSVDALATLLTEDVQHGVRERFAALMAKQKFNPDDVAAGQAYVEAYVEFIHYAERVYESAVRSAVGHFPETE